MSSVARMKIQGVRSFGPEQQDEQTIEFTTPISLIVGPNGCGKTTIIECLKLALCGVLPPNSKSGQSLVHDPKVSGVNEVKASIRLVFKNIQGQSMMVTRLFRLGQKAGGKMEFKGLDGSLKEKNPQTGENISQTVKPKDLDIMIPEYMGVSTPILDNVIFCHQEDSSWPMSESTVLKKKFDDIFESKGFQKALEEVKKILKEYRDHYKQAEADLRVLETNQKRFLDVTSDVEKTEEEMEKLKKDAEILNEERTLWKDKASKLGKYIDMNKDKIRESEKLQSVIIEKESVLEKERLELGNNSIAKGQEEWEVKQDIEKSESELNDIKLSSQQVQKQLLKLQQHQENFQKTVSQAKYKIVELKAKRDTYDQSKKDVIKKLKTFMSEKGISIPESYENSQGLTDNIDLCMQLVKDYVSKMENEMNKELNVLKKQGDELRNEASNRKADVTSAEKRLQDYQKEIELAKGELKQMDQELLKLPEDREPQGKIADINRKIIQNDNEQKELQEGFDDEKNKEDLAKLAKDLKKYEAELKEKKSELDTLQENRGNIHRIQGKRQDCKTELRQVSYRIRTELESLPSKISSQQSTSSNELLQLVSKTLNDFFPSNDSLEDEELYSNNDDNNINVYDDEAQRKKQRLDVQGNSKNTFEKSKQFEEIVFKIRDLVNVEKKSVEDLRKINVDKFKEKSQTEAKFEGQTKVAEERLVELTSKENILSLKLSESIYDSVLKTLGESDPLKAKDILINQLKSEEEKAGKKANMAEFFGLLAKSCLKSTNQNSECPACYQPLENCEYEYEGEKTLQMIVGKESFSFPPKKKYKGPQAAAVRLLEREDNYSSVSSEKDIEKIQKAADSKRKLDEFEQSIQCFEQLREIRTEKAKVESTLQLFIKEREESSKETKIASIQVKNSEELVASMKECFDNFDTLHKDLLRIRSKEEQLELEYGSSTNTSSSENLSLDDKVEDLKTQVKKLENRIKTISQDRERSLEELKVFGERQSELMKAKDKLQNERIKLEQDGRKRREIVEKRNRISAKNTDILSKQQETFKERDSKNESLRETEGKLKDFLTQAESTESKLRNNFKLVNASFQQIEATFKSVKDNSIGLVNNNNNNNAASLGILEWKDKDECTNAESILEKSTMEEKEISEKLQELRQNMESSTSKINTMSNTIVQLRKALKLSILEKELREAKVKKDVMVAEMQGDEETAQKLTSIETDFKKATTKVAAIEKDLGSKNGEIKAKQDFVKLLKEKTKDPELKDIVQRCKESRVEVTTYKCAADDCEIYYKTLETSLLEFHKLKIKEINERIRELWKLTYRGGDIDSIELLSEESATASRSYEYKLIMRRGDTDLEMRGRCSAGQKLLASIIIRLALAETFSAACGILALDEPTTNLDSENRAGLAEAIAKIIQSRSKQKNFQLIIITHDEDFVNLLKESGIEHFDFYHKVTRRERNGRFYSFIEKIDI